MQLKRKGYNYECVECGKRFPSQWKLERHSVVHTGMRPFVCPYCSKSHTQGDNLKIHIRKMHPEYPLPSNDEMRGMMYSAYSSPNLFSALTLNSADQSAHASASAQPMRGGLRAPDPSDPLLVNLDN